MTKDLLNLNETARYNIGIDFSITSPSVTVHDLKLKHYHIYVWSQHQKLQRTQVTKNNYTFEILYINRSEYENNYSFYYKIISNVLNILRKYSPNNVAIEDFAFGANGKISVLAECVGYLKFEYYRMNKSFIIPIPISFGKMIGNDEHLGTASKYKNIQYFLQKEIDLLQVLNLKIEDETPLADIVDSFNILKCLETYIQYNKDEVINEKIKKSFDKWKPTI